MSRMIDADALHFKIADWQLILSETYGENDEYVRCLEDVLGMVDNAPTIDAVEVKHGEWEVVDATEPRRYGCSVCKRLSFYMTNYCSCCGAKMNGERRE